MKRGDHNPKQNIRILKELVAELRDRDVEYVDVTVLEEVVLRIEQQYG